MGLYSETMETGFVYVVYDTLTQQYRKQRFQTVETAQAAADEFNAGTEESRYIIHPVSVF